MQAFFNEYLYLLQWLFENPLKSLPILFIQFVIAMKLHHSVHNKVLHFFILLWFIPQDIVVNMSLTTIIGMELPREWLVTSRMKRWKKNGVDGNGLPVEMSKRKAWQKLFATKLCNALNKYDAGHC